MSTPMEVAKAFHVAERGAGDVLASSSVYMHFINYEELTFMIATSSLPMLKNGVIEYSLMTGHKTFGKGKNQTYNQLPITFNERDTMVVKNALECIKASGINGELEVEFWVGDGEHVGSKLWGKAVNGFIVTEDNPEADSEGSETPMKISITLHCHYFPEELSTNDALRGNSADAVEKLNSVTGDFLDC